VEKNVGFNALNIIAHLENLVAKNALVIHMENKI